MDIKELKELIALMKESSLSELLIEEEGRKIRLRKEPPRGAAPGFMPYPMAGTMPVGGSEAGGGLEHELPADVVEFKAPMVGTFYRAPSPEADPYSEIGDSITPSSILCIIEAMKVMNEIKADVEGEIVDILAENGEAVEYGQPLFLIRRKA